MAFGPANFQPISAFPQRAIYPAYYLENVSVIVPGGGWTTLGGNAADGAWMISSYSLCSWALGTALVPMTVIVDISQDGLTYLPYHYVLIHDSIVNFMCNLFLPGWQARFRVFNTDTIPRAVDGFIRIQAVS